MPFFYRSRGLLAGALLLAAGAGRAQVVSPPAYPQVAGYVSVVHPLISFDRSGLSRNFSGSYVVGFPCGVNIWKSAHVGFSFEITPFVRASGGESRVSNWLFHPGVLFRLPHRVGLTERLAFETGGRYGLTTVLSKVLKANDHTSIFVATPLPLRLGNGQPTSIGVALQVGLGF